MLAGVSVVLQHEVRNGVLELLGVGRLGREAGGQLSRSAVVAAVRMSGRPQDWAVDAPPESKADIEPTIAKVSSQALV